MWKMDWRQIPSLQALRAFESAARHGSLSRAARELNVTHPAIAQHIRALERHFDCRLMEREGAGMTVTPEGRALSHTLTEGFGRIATACEDLAARDAARPLRLSMTPSFAASWLMPRIGDFWTRHPGIELELLPTPDVVDLAASGIDLAVRYGRGPWPDVEIERLVGAGHAIVAAPGLVEGPVEDLRALSHLPWMTETTNSEEIHWLTSLGLDTRSVLLRTFPNLSMVLEAVRAGHGVGLVPRIIAGSDIETGRVEVIFEEPESPLAYHILTRPGRESAPVRTLRRWLRSKV